MQKNKQATFSGFYYSEQKRAVLNRQGNHTGLRSQTVEVFRHLAVNHHRVVSRRELEDTIWADVAVTDDSLTKCISEIRKALGDDTRTTLKTFSKRGYQLCADALDSEEPSIKATRKNHKGDNFYNRTLRVFSKVNTEILIAFILILAFTIFVFSSEFERNPTKEAAPSVAADGIPRLFITNRNENEATAISSSLISEMHTVLNNYRTVVQVNSDADLHLQIEHHDVSSTISAELIEMSSGEILFAESYSEDGDGGFDVGVVANRLGAAIASPGVGAVDRNLLDKSRLVPVEKLSPAACYAYGYGCSKCSGEEDNITTRAEACLASLLQKNPDDSRAWALQATIYAHQYWWANTLPEPLRSNPALRQHLPQKAIDAAHKAESLSTGTDTGVYWGMAEAYFSACEADKLKSAIERGLEINPNDPNLLGAFGNWLSYSGKWEEGEAMTLRALEIEPVNYRKWWWMGPAKSAYFREDFKQAYQYFLKSFNERNWMSHLQQAYTLPHIGRVDDARKSVATLQYIYPGFTREKALEIYDLLCFPDSFLKNIDKALTLAGLPSRGSSHDLSNLTLPRAKVINLNGIDIEFLDVGSGETVLFVHGAFNDYRSWGHYMVPISEKHRYLSYSRRYFGTQDWQDEGENFSVEMFAKDLIALIEALDLEAVHAVSWSSGVRTAIAAAVMRPDLFKSMIHYEPVENNVMQGMPNADYVRELGKAWGANYGPIVKDALDGDNEGALENFYELVFESPQGSFYLERELLQEVTRQNARTIAVNLTRYAKDNIKLTCDYVSQLSVPTLIVSGEDTHEYWKLMSQRFAECIPNAGIVSISGSNHYAPLEKIEEFSEIILQFVSQNE